jgi:hypothetical protein
MVFPRRFCIILGAVQRELEAFQRMFIQSIYPDEIALSLGGFGVIFYSPQSVSHIAEGYDYFTNSYSSESDVQAHVQAGTLVGFAVGASGEYVLKFRDGYPDDEVTNKAEFKYRLAVKVTDSKLVFRDMYDLSYWRPQYGESQVLHLGNGIYHVTLCTTIPQSGIIGDHQDIWVFLQKLEAMPALSTVGMPYLCPVS